MTTEEYQSKYDDAPIYCEASVWKQRQKTWTGDETFRKNCSDAQKLYFSQDGNDPWNKGLTADDHPSLISIAEQARERWLDPEKNPNSRELSEKELERRSEVAKALWKDPEYRANVFAGRQRPFSEGGYISAPHQALIDAMKDAGIYEENNFKADEVWITLLDGSKHPIDIASRELKIAIEVDGCFFHGNFEKLSSDWKASVLAKRKRDLLIDRSLDTYGWTVVRVWEHEINEDPTEIVGRIGDL